MNYKKGFSLNFGGKAFSHEPAIGYNFYLSGNRIIFDACFVFLFDVKTFKLTLI